MVLTTILLIVALVLGLLGVFGVPGRVNWAAASASVIATALLLAKFGL